jgi:hypothetical protein
MFHRLSCSIALVLGAGCTTVQTLGETIRTKTDQNAQASYTGGKAVFAVTRDGVTVEASVEDTGSDIQADIRIVNASSQPVDVDPSSFVFEITSPKPKALAFEKPENVADRWRTSLLLDSTRTGIGTHFVLKSAAQDEKELKAREQAEAVLGGAFRKGPLAGHTERSGRVYFKRQKKKVESVLRVPLGREIFEFTLRWVNDRVAVPCQPNNNSARVPK